MKRIVTLGLCMLVAANTWASGWSIFWGTCLIAVGAYSGVEVGSLRKDSSECKDNADYNFYKASVNAATAGMYYEDYFFSDDYYYYSRAMYYANLSDSYKAAGIECLRESENKMSLAAKYEMTSYICYGTGAYLIISEILRTTSIASAKKSDYKLAFDPARCRLTLNKSF